MQDATIANTTDSAIGTNRKRATSSRKNIGTNTMQMRSVETNAGTPISPAPTSIASCTVSAVKPAAIRASRTIPLIAAFTNSDWSKSGVTLISLGRICGARGSTSRTFFTMWSVDTPAFLRIESSTPRSPSWRTMFVCGEKPSRTCATSRT